MFIAEGNERAARHSCVFFCNADYHAEVVPLPHTATAGSGGTDADGGGSGGADGGGTGTQGGGGAAERTTAGKYICEKLGLMYS